MKIPSAAPNFCLYNQDNKMITLESFSGKWLIIFFYPKDDTPGCTIEACSLRDTKSALDDLDVNIVGVNKDNIESHRKFIKKYSLNYDLLTDGDGKMIESYGAWGKKMFGREGIQRKTFVINPDGLIVKAYLKVTPTNHGEKILDDIKTLIKD